MNDTNMADQTNNPVAEVARKEMRALADAGWEAYREGLLLRAIDLYSRALGIAQSINDEQAIVRYRVWCSANLIELGRLREALTILTPILQNYEIAGDAADVYRALYRYIGIAQDIPVSLKAIEKAYRYTEDFLRNLNKHYSRHNLLYLRARLYLNRGMVDEAFRSALEAKSLWTAEYPAYIADVNFSILVYMCLYLRDAIKARNYLTEWETYPDNSHPKNREQMLYRRQSELARLDGRAHDAIDWARRALMISQQTDSSSASYSIEAMVRAFLSDGDCDRACEMLVQFTRIRHSERSETKYDLHLLRGDYHLASARKAAGMLPVDDVYGSEFPLPTDIADPTATKQSLIRAHSAYIAALRIGREMDEKLECTYRQREIAERQARVENMSCAFYRWK